MTRHATIRAPLVAALVLLACAGVAAAEAVAVAIPSPPPLPEWAPSYTAPPPQSAGANAFLDWYFGPAGAITSQFFEKKAQYHWTEETLLLPHETIRAHMIGVQKLLHVPGSLERPWKRDAFCAFYGAWQADLVTHHDAEERYMFPRFKARGLELPQSLTTDHEHLIDTMRRVQAECDRDDAERGSQEWQAAMVQTWDGLVADMLPHLYDEEYICTPLFRDHFTQQDYLDLAKEITANVDLSTLPMVLPMFAEVTARWAGPNAFNAMVAKAFPRVVHWWNMRILTPAFKDNVWGPLRHIAYDIDAPPAGGLSWQARTALVLAVVLGLPLGGTVLVCKRCRRRHPKAHAA